jgi:hypothetical protein
LEDKMIDSRVEKLEGRIAELEIMVARLYAHPRLQTTLRDMQVGEMHRAWAVRLGQLRQSCDSQAVMELNSDETISLAAHVDLAELRRFDQPARERLLAKMTLVRRGTFMIEMAEAPELSHVINLNSNPASVVTVAKKHAPQPSATVLVEQVDPRLAKRHVLDEFRGAADDRSREKVLRKYGLAC